MSGFSGDLRSAGRRGQETRAEPDGAQVVPLPGEGLLEEGSVGVEEEIPAVGREVQAGDPSIGNSLDGYPHRSGPEGFAAPDRIDRPPLGHVAGEEALARLGPVNRPAWVTSRSSFRFQRTSRILASAGLRTSSRAIESPSYFSFGARAVTTVPGPTHLGQEKI